MPYNNVKHLGLGFAPPFIFKKTKGVSIIL